MSNFYPDTARYPKVVKAVLESFVTQTARIVYPDVYKKDPLLALQKFIPSETEGGNFNLREATRSFEEINFKFPFTIYNFDPPEVRPGINQILARGEIYSDLLRRKIATYPVTISIKMLSFFTSPDDYFRAYTYMNKYLISLHRYYAGLKFVDYIHNQSKTVGIPYDIKIEFERGNYVNRFQEYLKLNRIYDIVFTAKLNYWDFFGSDILENFEIKDVIINLGQVDQEGNPVPAPMENIFRIPISFNIPLVELDFSENEPIDINTKELNFKFDSEIDEEFTEHTFRINPSINYNFQWSNNSDQLTIIFLEKLQKDTTYEIFFKTKKYSVPNSFDNNFTVRTES